MSAEYERILEEALMMACHDNAEYDTTKPKVKEFLFKFYFEKAKKKLDNER